MTYPKKAVQDYTFKARQYNETNDIMRPKELLSVEEFRTLAAQHRIRRIEVDYVPWSILFCYQQPFSEEALRNKEFYAKSIMKNPYPMHLSDIKKALEEFPLDKMQIDSPDFRLGFAAQDSYGRELTISFAYNQPVMSINGTQYKTKPELAASVIDLLPHKSYERINKELVYFWYGQGLSLGAQKNEQGIKIDKSNSGKLE